MKATPPRTAEQGAASIVMAADAGKAPNGSFTSDGEVQDWAEAPRLDAPIAAVAVQ